MKIRVYLIALIGLTLLLAACKKESNPTEPQGGGENTNYFPSGVGTYYKFNVITTDSAGSNIAGQRSTKYTGTATLNGTLYTVEADSVFSNNLSTTSTSHFRKTSAGVYYYLDTTGIGESVPGWDTLKQYISFDPEMREFGLPLNAGSTWPVFKMSINYMGFLQLNIINVNATAVGTENITLNLTSGQVTKQAMKVRYVMTLMIVDPNNPLVPITKNYEAYCWVVNDIGIARWQGNASVMGAFAGSGIDLGDSTKTVTQDLIQYDIK